MNILRQCTVFRCLILGILVLNRLYRDVQVILACIGGLPSDNVGSNGARKPGELDEFLLQRFGVEPPP